MDFEIKKMVEESLELSRENNKILRSMRSAARWGRALRMFYWIIIIASMLGLYYYFQPVLKVFQSQYEMGASFLNQLQEGFSMDQFFNSTTTPPQI